MTVMRIHTTRACLLAGAALLAGGCSSQQLYSAGQTWQQNECRKLAPPQQADCLKSTAMSFDEYQRQAAAAKGK